MRSKKLIKKGRLAQLVERLVYTENVITLYSQGFYKLQIFSVPIPYQPLNSKAFQAQVKRNDC